ncbi:hypothetical protein ACP26L_10055 [Paenibacillus sp. S-38]|uniref:hypothetical protein n=1 Tax=Paenibacillus sp. S-38 TaxID=3416710 RepID=UPI003CE7FB8C
MDSGGREPRELTYRDGWRRGKICPAGRETVSDRGGRSAGESGYPAHRHSLLWQSPHRSLPRWTPLLLLLLPAAVFAGFLWLVYLLARMI